MARFSLRIACALVALSCVACISVDDRVDAIGKNTAVSGGSGGAGGGGADPTLAAFQSHLWSIILALQMPRVARQRSKVGLRI
jgi:hypothetical protein